MTTEILTMLGMTVTILVASWTMIRSLRADLTAEIKDVRSEIKDVRSEIKDVRSEIKTLDEKLDGRIEALRIDVSNLSERMATLEGAMSALRDVIAGRAVA